MSDEEAPPRELEGGKAADAGFPECYGLEATDAPPPPPEGGPDAAYPDERDSAGEEDGAAAVFGKLPGGMGGHFAELRRRLVLCLAVFIPAFIAGLLLYGRLWEFLLRPLRASGAGDAARFQALNPSDGLVLVMQVAFAFALVLTFPFLCVQAWCFVTPGLTSGERRRLHLCFGGGTILFFLGGLTAYCAGIPFALAYLLPFNQTLTGWENAFTGSGYVNFMLTCCLGFGLAFETPLLMLALGWAGLVTPAVLRSWWRHIVLAVFLVSALMTPPDPFTQVLLALPLLVLFCLGWGLVAWTCPREKRKTPSAQGGRRGEIENGSP